MQSTAKLINSLREAFGKRTKQWGKVDTFKDHVLTVDGTQYNVSGNIHYACTDDSDFDREHGYGAATNEKIDRVDITTVHSMKGGIVAYDKRLWRQLETGLEYAEPDSSDVD